LEHAVRTSNRSRAARAAWAAPVLLLVLSGCSGGGATETATETEPKQSASETEQATTSAAAGELDEDSLVPAMMDAVEDQGTAHVTMTTSAGGQEITAEGDVAFEGKQQDVAMTMDGSAFGAGNIEVRMVDGVLYLAMPPMTPESKFVAVRPGDKGSPLAGMTEQMGSLDPRETFAAFEKGLRDVEYVGQESVDGEELHHYRLTVDFAEAAEAQGLPQTQGMPKTVEYDLWLDQESLMRKVEMDLEQTRTVMEMSDWGEEVTIDAPAKEDVVEMDQLQRPQSR
jgi:hypothetical protein